MICNIHGLAWSGSGEGGCPRCNGDRTERRYYEMMCVSNTQNQLKGTERGFIGAVVVERGVWSAAEFERRRAEFEREHDVECTINM